MQSNLLQEKSAREQSFSMLLFVNGDVRNKDASRRL
jgi:hypothetical protein